LLCERAERRRVLALSPAVPAQEPLLVVAPHRPRADLAEQRQRARRLRAAHDEVPHRDHAITPGEPDRVEQLFELAAAPVEVADDDGPHDWSLIYAEGAGTFARFGITTIPLSLTNQRFLSSSRLKPIWV